MRVCGAVGLCRRVCVKIEYISYSSFLTTMGNIWGSEKILPMNGMYLGERPRRERRPPRRLQKPLEEPLLEAEDAPPQGHWKEKALGIIRYVAERSRTINQGMLFQTGE